ncbi:MAG: HD-GYP domain-containing protein [Armatimonadetes bacterium]|nr:HD-GYP domain-containing protein [Armatimonadota bacterium]
MTGSLNILRLARRYYNSVLVAVAVIFAAVIVRTTSLGQVPELIKLLPLAALAEWLYVRLEPTGAFTLTPMIAFFALLLYEFPAVLVVPLAAIVIVHVAIRRFPWQEALQAAAVEGICLLALWGVFRLAGGWSGAGIDMAQALPFAAAALVYSLVKLVLGAAVLHVSRGVAFAAMWRSLLRQNVVHYAVMGTIALGLALLYREVGYFGLAMATVALVETYYPRKLLGDQKGVLFTGLRMIAAAVDAKDAYTYRHSQNVATYAVRLARAVGLTEDDVERIRIAALLHDIGKIGISGRIIRKPDRLTREEIALIQSHSSISADIMASIQVLKESADLVRHSHEHYDGSGYPDGMVGEAIPIGSRIILVADAFDALTTDRPYRRARPKEVTHQILLAGAGKQFDPRVVQALGRILDVV